MLSAKIVRKGRIDERALKRAVGKWLPIAGYAVEGQAKELAPVGREAGGNTKASIGSRVVKDAAIVGTSVFYAPFIEYGTGVYAEGGGGRKTPWVYRTEAGDYFRTIGMRPQPFMRPALDGMRKKLVEMLRKLYVAEVKKDGVK